MSDLAIHEHIADNNQIVIDHLLIAAEERFCVFAPWVITAVFYKALHLIEGIFYIDGDVASILPFAEHIAKADDCS